MKLYSCGPSCAGLCPDSPTTDELAPLWLQFRPCATCTLATHSSLNVRGVQVPGSRGQRDRRRNYIQGWTSWDGHSGAKLKVFCSGVGGERQCAGRVGVHTVAAGAKGAVSGEGRKPSGVRAWESGACLQAALTPRPPRFAQAHDVSSAPRDKVASKPLTGRRQPSLRWSAAAGRGGRGRRVVGSVRRARGSGGVLLVCYARPHAHAGQPHRGLTGARVQALQLPDDRLAAAGAAAGGALAFLSSPFRRSSEIHQAKLS